MRRTSLARVMTRACAIALCASIGAAIGVAGGGSAARADDAKDSDPPLPPGPIKDRHELMEGVGKNAKAIGGALKAGKAADVVAPAEAIASVMDKFLTLFPEGSSGQGSRAKADVWKDRARFDELAKQLATQATALAAAGKADGDIRAAGSAMFKTCKSCHDQFREPMQGE